MIKREFITKISEHFGNMSKFYKYIGYIKNASSLSCRFRHNKNKTENVDLKLVKILELYEKLQMAKMEVKILENKIKGYKI